MKIRVPYLRQSIGLGDALKVAAQSLGVTPCGGCRNRADRLNRVLTLEPGFLASPLSPARVGRPYGTVLPGLVIGGAIPPGLTVDAATRTLHGIPLHAGRFGLITEAGAVSIEITQ